MAKKLLSGGGRGIYCEFARVFELGKLAVVGSVAQDMLGLLSCFVGGLAVVQECIGHGFPQRKVIRGECGRSLVEEFGLCIGRELAALHEQTGEAEETAELAQGALVGNPQVTFLPTNNTVNDMMQGNFTWNIAATPTPQLKTARAIVAYTTDGFNAYLTSNQEGEE